MFSLFAITVAASSPSPSTFRYERSWEEMSSDSRRRLCRGEGVVDGGFVKLDRSYYQAPSGYRASDLLRMVRTHFCPSGLPLSSPIGPLNAADIVDFCKAQSLVMGTVSRSFFGAYVYEPARISGALGPQRIVLDGSSLRGNVLVGVGLPTSGWAAPIRATWVHALPASTTLEEVLVLHRELCR